MSNILEKIIRGKEVEVEKRKTEKKISDFESNVFFNRRGKSLKNILSNTEKPAILSEFKRKQVDKVLYEDANVQTVIRGYMNAGSSGVSVITEKNYYGGKLADLIMARQVTDSLIIRKDFIFDEFQLFESKAHGADAILLIADALTLDQVSSLAIKAKELNLEVIYEISNSEQLQNLNDSIDVVSVNVTNLDISTAKEIGKQIPSTYEKIATGEIDSTDTVKDLFRSGFKGFIIGSYFMSQENPTEEAKNFIEAL